MSEPAPVRVSVDRYFEMTECGIISPDDRVELLEGLIVSMAAQSAPHAGVVNLVHRALLSRLGDRATIRVQSTFLAGGSSVPEPDIAVIPGRAEDYLEEHPSYAHLIVEVAYSSVIQDRLTKSAIYARCGVPCYWIVNLRDHRVELFRDPDPIRAQYRFATSATGEDGFGIDAFPDVRFTAAELLPPTKAKPENA